MAYELNRVKGGIDVVLNRAFQNQDLIEQGKGELDATVIQEDEVITEEFKAVTGRSIGFQN